LRSFVRAGLLRWWLPVVTRVAATATQAPPPEPAADGHWYDRNIDLDDGQFDLRDHLPKRRGLTAVPMIIT